MDNRWPINQYIDQRPPSTTGSESRLSAALRAKEKTSYAVKLAELTIERADLLNAITKGKTIVYPWFQNDDLADLAGANDSEWTDEMTDQLWDRVNEEHPDSQLLAGVYSPLARLRLYEAMLRNVDARWEVLEAQEEVRMEQEAVGIEVEAVRRY